MKNEEVGCVSRDFPCQHAASVCIRGIRGLCQSSAGGSLRGVRLMRILEMGGRMVVSGAVSASKPGFGGAKSRFDAVIFTASGKMFHVT